MFFQEFAVRNDMPCGSTIGPILSAKLGIRTVGKSRVGVHYERPVRTPLCVEML